MKHEFKPFDRVLVRQEPGQTWKCALFSNMEPSLCPEYKKDLYYTTCGYNRQCIPFEGNEHLAGTTDEPTKPKLKVVKGNKERGDEVLKILMEMGGHHTGMEGTFEECYYFIDDNLLYCPIRCKVIKDSFFDNYNLEIIKLPKPKLQVIRGDMKRGDEVITLLEGLGGNVIKDFEGIYEDLYYYINKKGVIDANYDDSDFFKDYDLEILELPEQKPKRWRAEKGDYYYFVGPYCDVQEYTEDYHECDNKMYECGNYFETEEGAKLMADKIKKLFNEENP